MTNLKYKHKYVKIGIDKLSRLMRFKYALKDLRSDFPDDDACLEWLVNYRYPDGIFCVNCDKVTKHHKLKGRRVYSCQFCARHISPTAGTIFHKSSTPLTDWFHAIYMMSSNKAGTSAKQLERELGVSYKTAWRMMHQIREMMEAPDEVLTGEVEIDETFIHPNPFKNSRAVKKYGMDARRSGQVIVGAVERGGKAKVWAVKTAGARVLLPLIENNVAKGSLIHTDGYRAYRTLNQRGYEHRWTDHGKLQFYTERSHTQNVENLWSHFKRGIKGTYRSISPQHSQKYAQEFAYRYSHRKSVSIFWSLMDEVSKPVSKS